LIALICFFPVLVKHTVDGLAAVDPEQRKLLRTLDAFALARPSASANCRRRCRRR